MCKYDICFSSSDCVCCRQCAEDYKHSQQEDYCMEMARERDEPWD